MRARRRRGSRRQRFKQSARLDCSAFALRTHSSICSGILPFSFTVPWDTLKVTRRYYGNRPYYSRYAFTCAFTRGRWR